MAPALAVLAIGLLAAAAASDLTRRRIPNRLAAALAMLALVRIGLAVAAGGGVAAGAADVAASMAVFAAGATFFHFGLLGGGDVKLLAAAALWTGAPAVLPFLFATALAGGALAVGLLVWIGVSRVLVGRALRPSLPYGVAIAAGAILATGLGV